MANTNFVKKAVAQLKEAGYRITQPRLFVLELLSKTKTPLSSQNIHDELTANKKNLDLVSVYRILELLQEQNLVHKDVEQNGFFPCSHCKSCPDNIHIFLKCLSCCNVREIDYHGEVFADAFKRKLSKLKSKPVQENIYLNDYCLDCS